MPWWKRPTTLASVLGGVGLVATALIAYLGSGKDGVDPLVALLLTVLAGFFQVASASKFHSIGRADPSLARSSVRRLRALASRARHATTLAETAYEQGSAAEAKRLMGKLSSELSYVQEGAVLAIEDWREFHGAALSDIEEEPSGGQ